jgi:Gas vesicle synthesis protein GvpL/GvpF
VALYVYGIMRRSDAAHAVGALKDKIAVETVEHERISALVSPTPGTDLKLRRDKILAHADVLQAAFEHGPVLPFRFGTAVADADTVRRELLAPSADRLAARLDALDGKVEMQLKAVYAEEPFLRSVLAQDAALARRVERTQNMPAAASHFERIRIGEAIAAAVQGRATADGSALLEVLAPIAVDHVVSPPHHERALANVAFLVERAELGRFDEAVETMSEQRGAEIEFKLIGPMPPYSFADRDLSTDAERAGAAWA